MRINNNSPVGRSVAGGSRRAGGAQSSFSLGDSAPAKAASATPAARAITGVDAIVAIQSVSDSLLAKKRRVRHGHDMLDILEQMKIDLLSGDISPQRLNRLMRLVDQKLPELEPGPLRDVLEEIELRARVEIAKRDLP
jgi:hypothetical protein